MLYRRPALKIGSLLRSAFKPLLVALLVLPVLGASATAATSEIEGVWSFNGGDVGIQHLPNGTFDGTVVTPTKLSNCQHPVGQVMWTDMRQQADGSYWGYHQWYHGSGCEEVAELGLTAWRVLENAEGAHFLRVCFSYPGSESQPTIAPDGVAADDTYGCVNSALVEPLPTVSNSSRLGFGKSIVLPPSTGGCTRQKSLTIRLHPLKYDPFKEVIVRIGHKKVADVRGAKALEKAVKRGIVIRHLPGGTYKVSVLAITVLKQRISGSRTYHSCAKGSSKVKHHSGKSHRHSRRPRP